MGGGQSFNPLVSQGRRLAGLQCRAEMDCAQPLQFALHALEYGRPRDLLQPLVFDFTLIPQRFEKELARFVWLPRPQVV